MKDVLRPPVLRALERALQKDLPQRLQRVLGVSLGVQHLGYAVVRYDADCVQLGCVKLTSPDNLDGKRELKGNASAHFPVHIAHVFRSMFDKYRELNSQATPTTSSNATPWVVALRQFRYPSNTPTTTEAGPLRNGPREKFGTARSDADVHPNSVNSTRYRMEGMLVTALPLFFEVPSIRILPTSEIQWLLAQRLQEPPASAIDLETVAQRLVTRFPPPTDQTPKDVTRTMSAAWATAYTTLIKEQLEVIQSDPCIANAVHQHVDQCPKVKELREARDAHLQALCSSAGSIHQAYKSLRTQRSEALMRRLLFKMYSVPHRQPVGERVTG